MVDKKAQKDVMGMVTLGATTAVGSSILGQIGGTAATQAQAGLGQVASGMQTVGTVAGAGMALRQLKHLQPKGMKKDKALYG